MRFRKPIFREMNLSFPNILGLEEMMKRIVLSIVIIVLTFQLAGVAQAQKVGSDELTPLRRVTYVLLKNGYNFTHDSRFPEKLSFQKKIDSGKHIFIVVGSDLSGAVIKSFLIRVPISARDKETEIIFVGLIGLAETRGADIDKLIALADWFANDFWPRESQALKAGKKLQTGKYDIVVESHVLENGDIQIEIE